MLPAFRTLLIEKWLTMMHEVAECRTSSVVVDLHIDTTVHAFATAFMCVFCVYGSHPRWLALDDRS